VARGATRAGLLQAVCLACCHCTHRTTHTCITQNAHTHTHTHARTHIHTHTHTRTHAHTHTHTLNQGADFGSQARKRIEEKLRKGMSVEEIEWRLKNPGQDWNAAAVAESTAAAAKAAKAAKTEVPPKPTEAKKEQQVKEEVAPPPPAPKAAAPPAPVEVGQSMVAQKRDPLALIKVGGGEGGVDVVLCGQGG
jgi:hypothetical protein